MKQDLTTSLGNGRQTANGNTRTAGKEQYYTPRKTAIKVLEDFLSVCHVSENTLWVEPAGGTGSFIEALLSKEFTHILSVDVEPKHPLVKQADFLQDPVFANVVPGNYDSIVALTNPPFGRNNSLSVPFFKKLAEKCDYIGFIVPKSWRKFSVQNRLPLNAELVYDQELTVDYVDESGGRIGDSKGNLNTVFQIWRIHRNDDGSPKQVRRKVIVEDRGYIQSTTPDKADACLTIFGYSCGKLKNDWDKSKKVSTDLYLKVSDKKVLEALSKIDYSRFSNNVASVSALSIQEIRFLLNEFFDSSEAH